MRHPHEDLAAREPVWDALSTLFLDTDVSLSREWRSEILAASPYTMQELEEILAEEISPVCSWNKISVAGEWAGFDPDWLREKVLRNYRTPSWLSRIGRKRILRSQEWRETKKLVTHLRVASSAVGV
jgi:hypothetical protein